MYLPPEILFQIFLNLPPKTLRRFLTVSKLWHSIITSKRFISQHLVQPPHPQNNSFFFLEYMNHERGGYSYSLVQETHITETQNQEISGSLKVPSEITYRPTGFNKKLKIIGIANGLVLLIETLRNYDSNTFLWNPAVDVFVKLPNTGIESEWVDDYHFGFWFDSRNCDFKYMRIVYRWIEIAVAEVYSLNTGEWRRVNIDSVKQYEPICKRSHVYLHVYLHGRLHWIGYGECTSARSIMSFDTKDELFREISIPICFDMPAYEPKIAETMGRLAVIWDDSKSGICRIWVMKKYRDLNYWTNLCNIPMSTSLNSYRCQGIWKNGDVLLIRDSHHNTSAQLVRYAPGSSEELLDGIVSEELLDDLDIVVGGLSPFYFCVDNGNYEESLAFLDLKFSDEWMEEYRPLTSLSKE